MKKLIAFWLKHELTIWYVSVGCALGGFVLCIGCIVGYNANWSKHLSLTANIFRYAAVVFFWVYVLGLIVGFPTFVKGPRYAMKLGEDK